MNCLSDLKDALIKKGQKITEFTGYRLIHKGNVYGMSQGEFYINGEIIKKKDLITKLNLKG